MTRVLVKCGPLMLVLLLPAWLAAQVSIPMSGHPPAAEQPCPAMSEEPSESAARCNVLARTSNLSDVGTHMSFSASAMGGYDSAFDGRVALPASFEGGQFYANALFHKSSSDLLLYNTFTAINYQTGQGTRQFLDGASLSLYRRPSERTAVSLDVNNFYGNDAIRLMAPAGNGAVETGSYGIHTGMILANQATARFSRQSSETRWWSASVRNNFRNFLDDKSQVNTLHGRAELHFQPSSRSGVGIYEETANESGSVDCTTQGFGLVYEQRISSMLVGEVSAGPAFGTKGCVVTLTSNYFASLSGQPWRPTILYLSADRKLNDSSFVSAIYEDTFQGGINQEIGMWVWLKLQGGSIAGTVPAHVAPFRGYYVAGTIEKIYAAGLSFAVSAQHFNWSGISSIAPGRTLVMGSLSWSPGRHTNTEMQGVVTH